jgi:rhamnogalacturonan endolyase
MRLFTLCLLAACSYAASLFHDDFSRFPPGLLSQPMGQLNGAIQEYHYIEHRGVRTHPWRNPIVHLDSWAVSDEDGKPYIEQHLVNTDTGRTTPLFVTGDEEWSDYSVEASVKPLSIGDLAGVCGPQIFNSALYAASFSKPYSRCNPPITAREVT